MLESKEDDALSREPRRSMFAVRSSVERLLELREPLAGSGQWPRLPDAQLVNYLLSFLFHRSSWVKWRAVTALGLVVSRMAENSLESARNIMRRLMWSLNDESGGIGWGSAETMGEIMARSDTLAQEFHCILLSYVQEHGNPLENPLLERGVLWGIGRLAQARPEGVEGCEFHLLPYLRSRDPIHRGHALWALGFVHAPIPRDMLEALLKDETEIELYEDERLHLVQIRSLAGRCGSEWDGRR
jgi:hypothetical protein